MFGWDSCVTERIVASLDLQAGDFFVFCTACRQDLGLLSSWVSGTFPRLKANSWNAAGSAWYSENVRSV